VSTKSPRANRRARVKPQHILVPVDFSDSPARALRHAAKRAAESAGSLIIVHVVPADYGWLGIGRGESRNLDRSLQRQAADRLRAFAYEYVGHNVAADLEVRIGQPAEEIVAAARESKCDSIVLSTRGLTGLDRYLIGSVADRVARLAPCPVVLMRPGKRSRSRTQNRPDVLRFKHEGKRAR
jgi:nucleotide-binding universal stress UspA family protein